MHCCSKFLSEMCKAILTISNGDLDIEERTPENAMSLAEEIRQLRSEVKRLNKENKRLQEERDFLNEAAAFFAASRRK